MSRLDQTQPHVNDRLNYNISTGATSIIKSAIGIRSAQANYKGGLNGHFNESAMMFDFGMAFDNVAEPCAGVERNSAAEGVNNPDVRHE